jgi:hypothetical protein
MLEHHENDQPDAEAGPNSILRNEQIGREPYDDDEGHDNPGLKKLVSMPHNLPLSIRRICEQLSVIGLLSKGGPCW